MRRIKEGSRKGKEEKEDKKRESMLHFQRKEKSRKGKEGRKEDAALPPPRCLQSYKDLSEKFFFFSLFLFITATI